MTKKYDTSRLDALRVKKKPQLCKQRLLVGHDYLANEHWNTDDERSVTMSTLAVKLARRQLMNDSVVVPAGAQVGVFYVEEGYVVTFAWIEWVDTEV